LHFPVPLQWGHIRYDFAMISFLSRGWLFLTAGTKKGAAISLSHPLDGISATDTVFVFSLKYIQVILILTGISFQINKIRKACAPAANGTAQYRAYGFYQSQYLL
jgi:hypothetical protein